MVSVPYPHLFTRQTCGFVVVELRGPRTAAGSTGQGASRTTTPTAPRSPMPKPSTASKTLSFRRPGRRSGSAPIPMATFRRSGRMPPADASTSITRSGRRNATRRNSTERCRCRPGFPKCANRSRRTCVAGGCTRDRVIALALQLLDLGYFRSGSEQYAEENNSFGLATLLCEHVTLQRSAVEFDYPAKSGVRRTLLIEDPEVGPIGARADAQTGSHRTVAGVPQAVPGGPTFTPMISTAASRNSSARSTQSRICARGMARCWRRRHSSTRTRRKTRR